MNHLIKFCVSCHRRYLQGTTGSEGQCHACQHVKGNAVSKSTKIARKKAAALVLEETGGHNGYVLPLRELCLRFISDNIDDVEGLGYLQRETMMKFSRILSKRRQLNNKTISLFLGPDEDEIHMFDCTRLDETGLSMIPMQCSNLRVLHLGLCGRMTDKVLGLIGERCKELTSMTLRGAFLCTAQGFSGLFKSLTKLETLRLGFAARLTDDSLKSLANNCPLLRTLEINDCTLIGDEGVLKIQRFTNLIDLSLSSVGILESQTLVTLLSKVGPKLINLCLDKQPNLTHSILEAIQTHCGALQNLSMQQCPLPDDGMIQLLSHLKPLKSLDLAGNNVIEDEVINCVANIHGENLKYLNLNGLDELNSSTLLLLLTKLAVIEKLDLSWIRYFNLIKITG